MQLQNVKSKVADVHSLMLKMPLIHNMQTLGVDIEKLILSQPDSGEQALDITELLIKSGAIDLVVVDTVAALVPQAELDGEMGYTSLACKRV